MHSLQTRMILTLILFGLGISLARAGEPGAQPQDQQQQQVTSFYQGNDGGYAMVINNDLSGSSINVNTQSKMIIVQPGEVKGAFAIPSGGAFPMYIPAGQYQVGWGGSTTATATVNSGKTTTIAFEPYGPDNSGMRALINDGEHNTATVLYESDQQRLSALEAAAQQQQAAGGGAPSQAEQAAGEAPLPDYIDPSTATTVVEVAPSTVVVDDYQPVVVVEDDVPVVIYDSSPVVAVAPVYVPPMPAVTFAAGFITGAVTSAIIWNNFHYWNNDWYDHWHDWDNWHDHIDNRIDNRNDRISDRIDNRDDRMHDRIDNRDDRIHDRIDNRGQLLDNRQDLANNMGQRLDNRNDLVNNLGQNMGQRLDNRSDFINNRGGNLGNQGLNLMPPRPVDINQHPGLVNRQMPPAPPVDTHLGGGMGQAGFPQNFSRPGFQPGGGGFQPQLGGGAGQPRFNAGGPAQRPMMQPPVQRPMPPMMSGGGFPQSRPAPAYRMPERHSISTPPAFSGGGRSFGGGGRSFGGGGFHGGGGRFRR